MAQPSLSQQIRKLEDELGGRLFDRLGRKIALTPLGERFLEHARRVEDELEGARQDVSELLDLKRGNVSVGAIPTVAPYLLPLVLPAFRRACPEITVSVREDLTSALIEQLVQGELDLALLSLPISRGALVSERLLRESMLLVVPSRHPLARRRSGDVSLGEIVREPWLLLKDGHCFRDDVLHFCKRARVDPHVAFEAGQLDTLVAMVGTGAGVTLLPEMARSHFRHAGVRIIEMARPQPVRTIGVVRSREKYLTPAVRAFIQELKACFAGERDSRQERPGAPGRGRSPNLAVGRSFRLERFSNSTFPFV